LVLCKTLFSNLAKPAQGRHLKHYYIITDAN
jgi:hypothetical protein